MAATSPALDTATTRIPYPPESVLSSTSTTTDQEEEPPISPLERKTTLEKALQQRPEAKDLKNRHILLDTSAAP